MPIINCRIKKYFIDNNVKSLFDQCINNLVENKRSYAIKIQQKKLMFPLNPLYPLILLTINEKKNCFENENKKLIMLIKVYK